MKRNFKYLISQINIDNYCIAAIILFFCQYQHEPKMTKKKIYNDDGSHNHDEALEDDSGSYVK